MPLLPIPIEFLASTTPGRMLIDFKIGSAPPAASAPWHPGEPIKLAPQADAVSEPASDAPTAAPVRPRFSQAQGFGEQVPLRFAASQIVPSQVRVTFGPGVEPESPVSWKGGQPWNRVLATAVAPLGDRIQTGRMSVTVLPKN